MDKRQLIAGASLLALAGTARLLSPAGAATGAARREAYVATRFGLEIDGKFAGIVDEADGGDPLLSVAAGADRRGAALARGAAPLEVATTEIFPELRAWIAAALASPQTAHDVALLVIDTAGQIQHRIAMSGVQLDSVMTDGLDATSKDPLRFRLGMRPSQSLHQPGKGQIGKISAKAKLVLASQFAFLIQGAEAATQRAIVIAPFGHQRTDGGLWSATPIKARLRLADAAPLLAWFDETVRGKPSERAGVLHILSNDRSTSIGSVELGGLMPLRMSLVGERGGSIEVELELLCRSLGWKFP